jgi:hypothetical protein
MMQLGAGALCSGVGSVERWRQPRPREGVRRRGAYWRSGTVQLCNGVAVRPWLSPAEMVCQGQRVPGSRAPGSRTRCLLARTGGPWNWRAESLQRDVFAGDPGGGAAQRAGPCGCLAGGTVERSCCEGLWDTCAWRSWRAAARASKMARWCVATAAQCNRLLAWNGAAFPDGAVGAGRGVTGFPERRSAPHAELQEIPPWNGGICTCEVLERRCSGLMEIAGQGFLVSLFDLR